MKIGVITFWDSQDNYGQVLQAYALQVYLIKKGHDAFLIRYDKSASVKKKKPSIAEQVKNTDWSKLLDKEAVKKKLESLTSELEKNPDRKFNDFRNKHLNVSSKLYSSPEELAQDPPETDMYICGSDQVWNYEFIGDFKPFFLQFGNPEISRVSYAASFGHKELPEDVAREYQQYLSSFDAISVRETSGIEICKRMGYDNAQLLPDPTALLTRETWQKLSTKPAKFSTSQGKKIFIYTLGNRPSDAREDLFEHFYDMPESIVAHTSINKDTTGGIFPTIEEWLGYFEHCDVVLTNSFHGMLFSILFNKNFIGLPCTGANEGMNERLTTLMSGLGLEDHLLYSYDKEKVNQLASKQVDWTGVNAKLDQWRAQASGFLNLSHKKEPLAQGVA